jgi:outer membrane protein TolC
LDAQAQKYTHAADLAAKNRWPDFTLGMSYVDTGEALNPGPPGSGTDPIMATVSINLPIWRSKYDAEEREANLKKAATLDSKAQAQNDLNTQLETALFHYRDAGRKINLYRDTLVPKAEQSLSVARQAFEAGEADFLSLIDAERMLLEFELQYERARVERASRLAEIEKLVGAEVEKTQVAQQQGDVKP